MSRSKWKGPFIEKSFFKEGLKLKENQNYKLKTWSRKSTILPFLVGTQLNVYNGKHFVNIKIVKEMLKHKLGEFVPTRAKFSFKKKKK